MLRLRSIVFTGRTVVGEIKIRSLPNVCKSIVGVDASLLYHYAICQPMPTGLYTPWDFDVDIQRFKSRSNKARFSEKKVLAYFQYSRPGCKIESFHTTRSLKTINWFNNDGFCGHWDTVFEALGWFYHFCECWEVQLVLTDEDIDRGHKKRELNNLRPFYLRKNNYSIVEMWESEWKQNRRQNHVIKTFVRSIFSLNGFWLLISSSPAYAEDTYLVMFNVI